MATTWNPSDSNPSITFSNGNLTALTADATGIQCVRSTTSRSTGLVMFEALLGSFTSTDWIASADAAFGLGVQAATLTPAGGAFALGGDNNSLGAFPGFRIAVVLNNVDLTSGFGAGTQDNVGSTITFAVNFTTGKLWVSSTQMRAAGFPWNNNVIGSENPASLTGGLTFSTIAGGALFIMYGGFFGRNLTLNTAGPFATGAVTGFTPWDRIVPRPLSVSQGETVAAFHGNASKVLRVFGRSGSFSSGFSSGFVTSIPQMAFSVIRGRGRLASRSQTMVANQSHAQGGLHNKSLPLGSANSASKTTSLGKTFASILLQVAAYLIPGNPFSSGFSSGFGTGSALARTLNRFVATSQAQVFTTTRALALTKGLSSTNIPFSKRATSRSFFLVMANVANALETGSQRITRGILANEAFRIIQTVGFGRAAVSASQALALPRAGRIKNIGSLNIQSLLVQTRNALTKTTTAISAEAFSVVRSMSRGISGSETQAAASVRLIGKLLSSVSAGLASFSKVAAIGPQPKLLPMGMASVAAVQKGLSLSKAVSAATAQVAALIKSTTVGLSKIVGASIGLASAFSRERFANAPITSSILGSAAAATIAGVGRIVHGFSSQAIAAVKAIAQSPLTVAGSSAVSTVKSVLKAFTTSIAEALSLAKTIGKNHLTAHDSFTFHIKTVTTLIDGASSPQSAAVQTILRTFAKILTLVGSQVAAVVKGVSTGISAVSVQGYAIIRSVGHLASVATDALMDVVGPTAVLRRQAPTVTQGMGTSLSKALATSKSVVQSSAAHIGTFLRGKVVDLTGTIATSVLRLTNLLRGTFGGNVATATTGTAHDYSARSPEIASSIASRSVIVPAVQSQTTRLVKWFHFFIARPPGVLLPPSDGPAEPPIFSAMDPADTEVFTFDWSSRAEPGDPIASVTVRSIPAGMNFVGPVFVDGYLVEVTCGPMSLPEIPTVFGLRCSVVFVSGRRSSFTIAVPVRTL